MKKQISVTAVLVGAGAALWFFAAQGPNRTASARIQESKPEIVEAGDLNAFQVKKADRFALAEVQSRNDVPTLNVNGIVTTDVSRNVPVLSLTGGRVVEVHARLGDTVQAGQTLLRIHSPDLAGAFADYEKDQADLLLAQQQLERAQQLFDRGALAKKDLQTAADAERKAEVDLRTTAERIRILGADPAKPGPFVEIVAPASGVITEQNVQAGGAVRSTDNSPNLFTIADLSHVWVLCDVYENDLASVKEGMTASIRVNTYPDRVFRGRVSNISPILDPNTRSAKVRIELENPGHMLRPNMFATAAFGLPVAKQFAVVPASSVLRLHDKSWVFVAEGEGRFRRVEVQTGGAAQKGVQEVLGVPAGTRIAADALQLSSALDLEADEGAQS